MRSSRFRIEPGADRIGAVMLLAGGVLAAVALWLSDLPWPSAVAAWLAAAGICGVGAWRRQRPLALLFDAPDALRLDWRDGRSDDVALRRWRRLGPLVVLEFEHAPLRRMALWLPGLPLNDARLLMRQLARMRPTSEPSV